jgi:hypothetical protein
MDFDFEEFQNGLSLEMNENIQQDLLKRKNEEDERLLNIKNEKIKQDEINKKKIEDGNKQKELAIIATKDAEIKKNVDNALAIQKQQMTSEHENVKNKLIVEHNKQIQALKTEIDSAKASILSYSNSYSSLHTKCSNIENEYSQYISHTTSGSSLGYRLNSCCSDTAIICDRCKKLKCKTHTDIFLKILEKCDLKISCECY